MVTPILIDGFEHQAKSANSFSSAVNGLWETITGSAAITFPSGRNGVCMQVAPAAAACRGIKQLNDPTVIVASVYFNTSSAPATQTFIQVQNSGFSNVAPFQLLSSGKVRLFNDASIDTAATYNDGAWHRLDFRCNVSANPWTTDWQIDGAVQTQGTVATAASVIRYFQLGTGAADTYTCKYDDLVISTTSGDYPLGVHDVLYGAPTGDGTHVAGTNVIEDNAGTDITSPNAFPLMDEWPANTADFVRQFATGAGNYAEVTFDDQPANKTIWGVEGAAALFSSSTTANNGTTRIVDSAGTTLTDIYTASMAQTSLHYRRAIITAPGGGWDGAGYAGVKARVGFSTNVASLPEWSALMLQYAVIDAGGAAAVVDPMGMSGFFGG